MTYKDRRRYLCRLRVREKKNEEERKREQERLLHAGSVNPHTRVVEELHPQVVALPLSIPSSSKREKRKQKKQKNKQKKFEKTLYSVACLG